MSNKEKFEKLATERGYSWLYREIGADEHVLLVGAKGWTEQQMREQGWLFNHVSENELLSQGEIFFDGTEDGWKDVLSFTSCGLFCGK